MAKKYAIRIARRAGLVALFVVAASLGIATGVIFAYAGDLPQISALDDYTPSTITRVFGSRGEVIGEFSTQRREIVPYQAISPKLKQAILAAEDSEFERHFGLSMPHIIMAATREFSARSGTGSPAPIAAEGREHDHAAARPRLFPEAVGYQIGDISLERKIKEAIVAVQIEKRYTKREIFTLYANQMYLGRARTASRPPPALYFGKSAKDLTLEEAALIAGHHPVPGAESVCQHEAREARDGATCWSGWLRSATSRDGCRGRQGAADRPARAAEAAPSIAPYFVEEVRKYLEQPLRREGTVRKRPRGPDRAGLRLQEAANHGARRRTRRIDKRRGFRKPPRNIVAEGHTLDGFTTTAGIGR